MAARVLVLGGTGFIGAAVVAELRTHGYDLTALARSREAATRLEGQGCSVVQGDIRDPGDWLPQVGAINAVVHMAATFDSDMATADRDLIDGLIDHFERMGNHPRLLYTGGIWLYGPGGTTAITETSSFDAFPPFAWMVDHRDRLIAAATVETLLVHPGMVYDRDGGVITMFLDDARAGGPVRVPGDAGVRWPVVHRDDLAVLYRLVLERGRPGVDYHGVAERAVPVVAIARSIARRYGVADAVTFRSPEDLVRDKGFWAAGYALDREVSGAITQSALGWQPRHHDIIGEVGARD